MGNSNSSVQVGHHPIPSKWSSIDQSLHDAHRPMSSSSAENHHRNRMKKAYFPPNHYLAQPPPLTPHAHHPLLVQPQHLVLPEKVNLDELRLKPTSNGKLLHGGGTISGRKLMNELEITPTHSNCSSMARKKSNNSSISQNSGSLGRPGTANGRLTSGKSTPNLADHHEYDEPPRRHSNQNQRSSPDKSRDTYYESNRLGRHDDYFQHSQQQPQSLQSQPTNSLATSISESPTKKQIRCRKKSNAPMPPLNTVDAANGRTIIGDGIVLESLSHTKPTDPQHQSALLESQSLEHAKKKTTNRMFKTKGEVVRSSNNSGDNCGNTGAMVVGKWEQMPTMKGKGEQEQSKKNQPPKIKSDPPHHKDNGGYDYEDEVDGCKKERTTILAIKNNKSAPPLSAAPSVQGNGRNRKDEQPSPSRRHDPQSREVISGGGCARASKPETKTEYDKRRMAKRIVAGAADHVDYVEDEEDDDDEDDDELMEGQEVQKRTFYFGMEEDSTNTMRIRCHNNNSHNRRAVNNAANESSSSSLTRSTKHANSSAASASNAMAGIKDKATTAAAQSKSNNRHDLRADNHTPSTTPSTIEKRKGIENTSSTSKSASAATSSHVKSERVGVNQNGASQGSGEGDRIVDKNFTTNKMGQRSSSLPMQQKPSSHKQNELQKNARAVEPPRSGSDSDGLHYRQDSGTFDDFSDQPKTSASSKGKHVNGHARAHGVIHESSSSDLSSSEMDIPILLRPTLPQKRHELPRFSPASAWRALDSPPVSGRSLSSEEGFHHDDGIQRYNARLVAPSRNGGLNERSGDSGISAGDSPAIPDIIIPPSLPSSKKEPTPIGGKTLKCWTPEQDLDESSSEFDENEMIASLTSAAAAAAADLPLSTPHNNVHSSSSTKKSAGHINPPGSRTPPKLTTKKHFFSSKTSAMNHKHESNNDGDSDSETNTNPSALKVQQQQQRGSSKQVEQFTVTGDNKHKQQTQGFRSKGNKLADEDDQEFDWASKPSLRRITNYHQRNGHHNNYIRKSSGRRKPTTDGLGVNWFLSRSEPNSLNNLRMMTAGTAGPGAAPVDFILHAKDSLSNQHEYRGEADGGDEYSDDGDNCGGRDGGYGDDDVNFGTQSLGEVQSDIGYGPSSLNTYYYHSFSNNGRDENGFGGGLRRPFSQHIIYLPSYDSRRYYQPQQPASYGGSATGGNYRKAKSVDNLESMNVLYKPSIRNQPREHLIQIQRESEFQANVVPAPLPDTSNFAEQAKRKKFKFQSTLRVLERKQIEKQLAQEAQEKEMERLQEIEAMKAVEEEFQKKRAKEKQEQEIQQLVHSLPRTGKGRKAGVVQIAPWEEMHTTPIQPPMTTSTSRAAPKSNSSAQYQAQVANKPRNGPVTQNGASSTYLSGGTTVLSIVNSSGSSPSNPKQVLSNKSSSSSNSSSNVVVTTPGKGKGSRIISSVNLNQRQEPEGAPSSTASGAVTDLRRELIQASRRRNGTNSSLSSSTDPLSTQELSEYRQETRQYWDYCRKPSPKDHRQYRHHQQQQHPQQGQHTSSVLISSNSSRLGDSSSDVYPVSSRCSSNGRGRTHAAHRSTATTYQHPEIVCEIPAKPLSHSSRLSGSTSNLLDDRSSLLGSHGGCSGPSSVISDNYRKDWAHKNSGGSSIIHIGGGLNSSKRASSIVSLHSAPGYTSSADNFGQQSSVDFSVNHAGNGRDHSDSDFQPHSLHVSGMDSRMNGGSRVTVNPAKTHIQMGNGNVQSNSSVIFQAKPFGGSKTNEYRPVVFKPAPIAFQMNSLS